ncbi:MAG: alpha/beta hydrolase [Burkholderiaceae bacterium]
MTALTTLQIDDGNGPALQLLHARADRPDAPAMLLVHGAYTSAQCWAPTFMPYFRSRGYDVYAVSLRGHGGSKGKSRLDVTGLSDYLDDIQRAACRIGRLPVLIGSSMGGLLVQRWLTAGRAAKAAVLLCSVPPSGLSAAAMQMAFSNPQAFAELAQLAIAGSVNPGLMNLLCDNPLEDRLLKPFYRELGRESTRALWESTWAPMVGWINSRCPVLAVHGENDRMVPVDSVRMMSARLNAEAVRLPGIGHLPMIDKDWMHAADAIDGWLRKLCPAARPAAAA